MNTGTCTKVLYAYSKLGMLTKECTYIENFVNTKALKVTHDNHAAGCLTSSTEKGIIKNILCIKNCKCF